MNLIQIVAKNIKRYRQESNLSQEDLAFKSGLHRTYISDIERCQRNVSLSTLNKISMALEIEPYLLLKTEENHEHK